MSEGLVSPGLDQSTLNAYALLRESCGLIRLDGWALVEMTGEDRKAWLQGQCTNDLKRLGDGGSISFCICSPTGQMQAMCTAFSFGSRYYIALPSVCLEALLTRVETMVIMEDVSVKDVTENYEWFSVQGPSATRALSERITLPTMDVGEDASTILFRNDRSGLGGWDVLIPKGQSLAPIVGIEPLTEQALNIARLEAGIPRFGADCGPKTLPPEMGPYFESRYISYTKGCYTGQEVLMRIHSRGHTNKTWAAIVLDRPVNLGDSVSSEVREDAGVITSASESPAYGFIAAAMLRNEVSEPGTIVQVGDAEGEVRAMPLLQW